MFFAKNIFDLLELRQAVIQFANIPISLTVRRCADQTPSLGTDLDNARIAACVFRDVRDLGLHSRSMALGTFSCALYAPAGYIYMTDVTVTRRLSSDSIDYVRLVVLVQP